MLFKDKYIDFHTHNSSNDNELIEVVSKHFDNHLSLDDNYFTIGRHPWWSKELLTTENKEQFINILNSKNCLGIGEIGLDKLKGVSLSKQIKIFTEVLDIASQYDKSVIIHCVKSYDRLLNIKKEFPNIKKWCIHGYARNTQLAKQLLDNGFYLSIGLNNSFKYDELIKYIPIERLFLETDGNLLNIKKDYLNCSKIKNIPLSDIKGNIHNNFKIFFNLSDF